MSKIVKKNLPCLNPLCESSDARQLYDTGSSFCFSCQTFFPASESDLKYLDGSKPPKEAAPYAGELTINEINTFPFSELKEWKIPKKVAEFYGVRVSFSSDGKIDTHYYPYADEGFKIRKLPKNFTWLGKSDKLFGQSLFSKGKRLIVTEGEKDTLAIATASYMHYNKFYPIIGLSSSTMAKHVLNYRDWFRSFNEVIFCGDEDEAGYKARDEIIKILGYDKVKIVKLPKKDAWIVFDEDGPDKLMRCIWDAEPYTPVGIVKRDALWQALITYNEIPSVLYPPCMEGVNKKTKGRRGGEITLLISGTGSGKSTLLREDMLHILQTSENKIGIIALEEIPAETARKLSGMELCRNPAYEEIPIDELKAGFDKVFGDDRVLILDHQGSMNDCSVIDKLEYMCLSGCKYLYIDHITILVSEGIENLVGNEAQDRMMNELLRLVKRYPDVWIGLVSHLRKAQNGKAFEEGRMPCIDDIRGSGSIKQISFDIIAFTRNLTATEELERNTILMSVLKCRYTGLTGAVPGARYNFVTGRLSPCDVIVEEFVSW